MHTAKIWSFSARTANHVTYIITTMLEPFYKQKTVYPYKCFETQVISDYIKCVCLFINCLRNRTILTVKSKYWGYPLSVINRRRLCSLFIWYYQTYLSLYCTTCWLVTLSRDISVILIPSKEIRKETFHPHIHAYVITLSILLKSIDGLKIIFNILVFCFL